MISPNKHLRFDSLHLLPAASLNPLIILGWQERVTLPNFGGQSLVAKIDTGAISSCLHAIDIQARWSTEGLRVSFRTAHPAGLSNQDRRYSARVVDQITVRSSHGTLEHRYVIQTQLKLGIHMHDIRLGLSDRSSMQFALLIGRDAIQNRYLIDCSRSFVESDPNSPEL